MSSDWISDYLEQCAERERALWDALREVYGQTDSGPADEKDEQGAVTLYDPT